MSAAGTEQTPGFDVQVNGYAGADFNSESLTLEAFETASERLVSDGCGGILATVITDSPEAMCARLSNIVRLREVSEVGRRVVHGIHIEGPFLSSEPGYIGAHPAAEARTADVSLMQRLLDAAGGLTKIVTLAPEMDPDGELTSALAGQGIVVAAGHCDPTRDQLLRAIDAGLSMFTHLGNGCPQQMHRHDNIVQRVLSLADRLWISFIADGAHVPPFALRNYLRCADLDRTIITTDAISAAGLGPGTYTLAGQTIEIGDDLIPWAPDRSHFIGSAATLPRMRSVLAGQVGLNADVIDRLTGRNPRRLLGLS